LGVYSPMTEKLPRLRLLGGFRFEGRDGEERAVRARKARALLARIAMSPGRPFGRDELAGLLWGSMPDERARHNLRQCVSALRKDLGDDADVVISDAESVRVERGRLEVDALTIEEAAQSSDGEELEDADIVYDGDFLAGLEVREDPFDEWVDSERRRLRSLACDALARRGRLALSADQPERAIALSRRRLALDPACEEAHRTIMEAHLAAGRRSDAMAQYRACEDALSRLLNARPSRETQALKDAIERGREGHQGAPRGGDDADEIPTVAVLPFDNLSGDPEERFFCDGMAEDVITALCRFDLLEVIARQSSFRHRDSSADPAEIGRELGAGYLVSGSVRRAGPRLRVNVQLTDAATGKTLWAERYDRALDEIFEVQDAVTHELVATLVNRVEADRLARARRAPTESLMAYECLLRGKDHHHRYTAEDNALSQSFLARAIELDPTFASAHAWMACAVAQSNAFDQGSGAFERAYRHVLRAHELDAEDSECHRILASYYLMNARFEEAERHQRRALSLNPNDDRIVCQMGELLTYLGRPAEGLPWIEKAMRLNPFHPESYHHDHGRALLGAGHAQRAVAAYRAISRPRSVHRMYLVASLVCAGEVEAARREAEVLSESGFEAASALAKLPYRDRGAVEELGAHLEAAGL
jgi:TolB-like protein/Tfp pilus assembly protein PilF